MMDTIKKWILKDDKYSLAISNFFLLGMCIFSFKTILDTYQTMGKLQISAAIIGLSLLLSMLVMQAFIYILKKW